MHLSQKQLFLQHLAQTTDFPLSIEIDRAEGLYLYTPEGKKYLDLISGISVSNVGHRHPKVVEAIKEQVDKYLHLMVYGEYIQSPQVQLAHLLSQELGEGLDSVYFVNSGSEATEGALKLAKRFTGRPEILAMNKAYHGSTSGALSVIGSEEFKNAFRPLSPGVGYLEFNDEKDLEKINKNTAAVIVEPVQGEAGYIPPQSGYLKALSQKCKEEGALLIFDEVQCGFGRTGSLFAFQQLGVIPDIITIAKGMGGGMPIGAFVSSKKIMDSFKNNPILGHITTFGGHPVSCAASLATLKLILQEDLITSVKQKHLLFKELLKHPAIKEVRGMGLMLAVQLDNFENIEKVIQICLEKGLIIDWFLFCDSALRISPPLIIEEKEIRESCEIILQAIAEVYD
tara:strand:- start:967 stop:2160 length:1194 start_codon:yes stop_codon:yes gene_type:complete